MLIVLLRLPSARNVRTQCSVRCARAFGLGEVGFDCCPAQASRTRYSAPIEADRRARRWLAARRWPGSDFVCPDDVGGDSRLGTEARADAEQGMSKAVAVKAAAVTSGTRTCVAATSGADLVDGRSHRDAGHWNGISELQLQAQLQVRQLHTSAWLQISTRWAVRWSIRIAACLRTGGRGRCRPG